LIICPRTIQQTPAAVRANLPPHRVVEVAVALWALQQGAAGAPEPLVAHAFGEDALALAVAAVGARVLAGDLQDPPAGGGGGSWNRNAG